MNNDEARPPRPPDVPWTSTNRKQVEGILGALKAQWDDKRTWRCLEEIERDATTERLAGPFQNTLSPWKAVGTDKVLHTYGVVARLRLEVAAPGLSGLFRPGSPSHAVARMSLAYDPTLRRCQEGERGRQTLAPPVTTPIVGLGMKFPVWLGPAIDLAATTQYPSADGTVLGGLRGGFWTETLDPRDPSVDLPWRDDDVEGRLIAAGLLRRLDRAAQVLDATGPGAATAVRLPIDHAFARDVWGGVHGPPCQVSKLHIRPTDALLVAMEESLKEDEDFSAWSQETWSDVYGAVKDDGFGHVYGHTVHRDDSGTFKEEVVLLGTLLLESVPKPSRVADHWLTFRHHIRGLVCPK